ncbi:dihydrofolate reductase family protein [Arthrobacter alpinus]|uniref:dihydrofolate reductase family protein n=1 Tax=Arthrobacter alpinus TaxID=656366 RepID=UPI0016469BA0|nr:dihydrofolate reductase family protein [Arthrobacter alpinus]
MGVLIYIANTSLDGYVADERGRFDWTEPTEEVHRYINDVVRPVGTGLYGRRMYEVMAVWEDITGWGDSPGYVHDFAEIWAATDKVVYSSTLAGPTTERTRIERSFTPGAVRSLKEASASDLTVGGANLAGQALQAGLVDEIHLFISPVIIGVGAPALPADVRTTLELLNERKFGNGVVHLHYKVT